MARCGELGEYEHKVKVKGHSSYKAPRMIARFLLLLFLQKTGWAYMLSSQQAMMGKSVNIPCRTSPIDPKSLSVTWYFQEKVMLQFQDAEVMSSDPRISYKGRAVEGIADLSILNITIEDGGIYRCSIVYRGKKEEKEIRLDVQAPPQITITDKVVVKNKESSLQSMISGFYPVDIDIKWLRDGQTLDNVIIEKPQRAPDGTYSVRSSVTITPTEKHKEGTFSCRVQHESLIGPLQENFQLVYGDIPSVHITFQALKLNEEQSLVCSVSGFYPEPITVNWFLNDTLMENAETRRISSSAVESVYHFTPTEQNWGMELSCVVDHITLITPYVERLLLQETDLTARYKLHTVIASVIFVLTFEIVILALLIIQKRKQSIPKLRTITRSSDGTLRLDVDHFEPEEIKVFWELIQPPSSAQPCSLQACTTVDQNPDGTFNATSFCETLREKIRKDEEYVVRAVVKHQKLKHPLHREWRSAGKNNKDLLSQPEVDIIQIPSLIVNKQAQLKCTVSHFYPDELTVEWSMREKGTSQLTSINNIRRYTIPTSSSYLQRNKTFYHTALLGFTPSLRDQGSEVIFRVSHPSLKERIERTTGPLHVLAKPEIQEPIKLSVTDSGDVVGCLTLLNFHPRDISTTWTCKPLQTQEEVTEDKITDNPDGTFTLQSRYKVQGTLLKNKQFIMKVTWNHETMEKPEHTEISIQDADFPWRPRIEHISPLILRQNQETTVECTIAGYFPENLTVTWIEKRGKSAVYLRNTIHQISDIRHERMADNTYQCSPSLSFTPRSVNEDLEFICRVEHPSLERPIEQSTGPPRINVPPKVPKDVQLTATGPDNVLCSLSLMKFYPHKIDITWSCKERYTTNTFPSIKKIIQTNDNKEVDAISECPIPWRNFLFSIRVTWTHESLQNDGFRDVSIKDFPWHPVIEEMDKVTLFENKVAKLQYKISNFFPNNVTVTWYKKTKHGNWNSFRKHSSDTSRAELQPDNTYSCTTSARITPKLPDDQESEFKCSVEHPSLEQPIEKRTGPLQVCACPKLQDSIKWSLNNKREAILILHLQRFYPRCIDIQWQWSCGQSLRAEESYETNYDTTFNVTSECTVPYPHMTHQTPTIRVTWKHETMKDSESREMCVRDKDYPWRPEVTEILCPVLLLGHPVTVQCDISNFFPTNLIVTWFVKERGSQGYANVEQKGAYKTMSPTLQPSDSGYSCTSAVQFTPSLPAHQGVVFKCEVKHPSLENLIIRTTEPLSITKAPQLLQPLKITPSESGDVLCSVRLENFSPQKINFKWTFGGNEKKNITPKKTLLVDEENDLFGAISECRIPRIQLKFPVRVTWEHESLEEPQWAELSDNDRTGQHNYFTSLTHQI